MLPLLERGATRVVWLDSDALVTRDPAPLFDVPADTLTATQEYANAASPGSLVRTRGWGLRVAREFERTINTAVVSLTRHHVALLKRWQELLETPEYQRLQRAPVNERPVHAFGDQDVLTALLGSTEFASVPVRLFGTGKEIIHCGGVRTYTLGERLELLFGPAPTFLHSNGMKPWIMFHPHNRENVKGMYWQLRKWLVETSPYVTEARSYRDEVGLAMPWLDVTSRVGAASRLVGRGHHAWQGLPLAIVATTVAGARDLVRRG
jgi:hypothetical protein